MTEWDLLVESEGIKRGDLIVAEDQNTNELVTLTFVKLTKGVLICNSEELNTSIKFSAHTLESYGDYDLMIVGSAT
jgi:hypothetical protein